MLIPERIRLWREDAAVLRRRGASRAAALMERLAAELEADVREAEPELLDLMRAADLSGYTRGHLRRMLAQGKLTNHGTEAEPLLSASEMPRKPRPATPSPPPGAATRRVIARDVVGK